MIKNLVQVTLDTALYPLGVYVHEQRKSGPDADMYVVYSLSGDAEEFHADNKVLVKAANPTVRFYYRSEKLDNYATRQIIQAREYLIESAMKAAGFTLPFGRFDAGDVDGIGYMVTVFEFEYWRVV